MLFLRRPKRLSLNCHECRSLLVIILAFLCLLPSTEATFRLCGFRLTMTLTAICKNQLCGGYFVPTKKRSDTSPLLMPSQDYDQLDSLQPSSELFPNPHNNNRDTSTNDVASTFTHYHAVSKRSGIATECCEKRCSLAYLRTYCCAGFQLPAAPAGLQAAARPATTLR